MKLIINSLIVAFLICIYSCKDFSSENAKASKREILPFKNPNILIFMMDDMGYGDIRALNPEGSGFLTPNLDQLIQEGVCFTQAHSADALCAPSRYSILTGNQVFRGRRTEGTWDNLTKSQIMPDQKTLANVLSTAGYATAFFGKSHLGGEFLRLDGKAAKNYGEANLIKKFLDGPKDHGFDYTLTLPGGIQESPYAFFKNDRLSRWNRETKKFVYFDSGKEVNKYFKPFFNKKNNLEEYKMDNWTTESVGPLLMRDALNYIDGHVKTYGASKPFFIHYCSQAGHTPFAPPSAFNINEPSNTEDLFKEGAVPIKGQTVNIRTDMIYEGDLAMGLFIKKLREKGILENTLIIFASDNGVVREGVNVNWTNPVYHNQQGSSYTGKERLYGGASIETDAEGKGLKHINAQGVSDDGKPLRGFKGLPYEGGHRIPLIFRWGNNFKKGYKIRNQLISLHDIFRTVTSLVNVEVDNETALDSYDFSSALKQSDVELNPIREYLFIQSNQKGNNQKSINWAAYKHKVGKGNSEIWKSIIEIPRVLYGAEFQFKLNESKAIELYNLSADPSENDNIVNERMLIEIEKAFKVELNKESTIKINKEPNPLR